MLAIRNIPNFFRERRIIDLILIDKLSQITNQSKLNLYTAQNTYFAIKSV